MNTLTDIPDFEAAVPEGAVTDSDVRAWLQRPGDFREPDFGLDPVYAFLRDRFGHHDALITLLRRNRNLKMSPGTHVLNAVEEAVKTHYPDFDRAVPVNSEARSVYGLLLNRPWWT